MQNLFDASLLQSVFERSFQDLPCGALVDEEGQTLFLKYQNLSDIGTFPAAAQTSDQYMKIQHGDFVILNDPYSGGTVLTSMTLVTSLDIPCGPRKSDRVKILMSSRFSFKPRVVQSSNIEEEGVRIPPSPLKTSGEWNQELFQFMEVNPLIPNTFKVAVVELSEQMNRAKNQLLQSLELLEIKLNKKTIQQFLSHSFDRARQTLGDLSIGEKSVERALGDSKEKLALRIEVQDERVLFDFTNSTNSRFLHLTDAATEGACAGALFSSFERDIPISAGTLRVIEVITPKGSLVNAKYPDPVFLGFTDGVALVALTVIDLIGQIDPRKGMAQSGFSQCSLEVSFKSGPHYFEFLESGVAASKERPGAPALDLWKRNHLIPSIEAAENILPVKIISSGYRQNSGGSGSLSGGNGVTRTVQIQEDGKMTWVIPPPFSKPEGVNGGKAASPAEFFISPPGESKMKLDHQGSMNVRTGTLIIMNSAGGGGMGEPVSEDNESE